MNKVTSFSEYFTVEDSSYRFFQQDGATAHSVCKSTLALWNTFWDRTISFPMWPANAPNQSTCDYNLLVSLKDNIHKRNP